MNELFVNVKVDREERPDVDSLYMDAVVALTGSGGWPMTVFLTPDGEPFLGGTYFPPEPRHGLPSFREVLRSVADDVPRATRRRRAAGAGADRLRARVGATRGVARAADATGCCTRPCAGSARGFDERWGGWGGAPKFPQASTIEFLLRRGELEPATKTLDGMALGGMYDLLGGGFHRYSVDARWLVPHFEKMLYDNALLVPAYLHGWLVTGNERYREIVEETVDVHAARARAARGRLRLGAGRRHGRRRGPDVHVDAGRGRARASSSSRSSTAASSSAASCRPS